MNGPAPRAAGFSLIEVLFAMVLIAVGFLGLQALSIGAARMAARAEVRSDAARLASRDLELALQEARTGATPQSRCEVLEGGRFSLSREVGGLGTRNPEITVTVTPDTSIRSAPAYTLRGSTYAPSTLTGSDQGQPC